MRCCSTSIETKLNVNQVEYPLNQKGIMLIPVILQLPSRPARPRAPPSHPSQPILTLQPRCAAARWRRWSRSRWRDSTPSTSSRRRVTAARRPSWRVTASCWCLARTRVTATLPPVSGDRRQPHWSLTRRRIEPSVRPSVLPSVRPSVGRCVDRLIRPSVLPLVGRSVRRSVCPLIRQSVCLSVRRSIGPSVRWSVGRCTLQVLYCALVVHINICLVLQVSYWAPVCVSVLVFVYRPTGVVLGSSLCVCIGVCISSYRCRTGLQSVCLY